MAGGDAEALEKLAITVPEKMEETPAQDWCKERDGVGLARTNETEAPKAADHKDLRGRPGRMMATTRKW